MDNVAPARALARRSYNLLQLAFVVVAIGIFISIVALLGFAIPPIPPSHPQFGLFSFGRTALLIIGIAVGLLGLGMAVRAFTRRQDNNLALIAGDYLAPLFDNQYSFVRNINRPGLGYIDAVMIGPPGALVFRIVDNTGNLANEAAEWMKQNAAGEWVPLGFSPTRQAVEDVDHLRTYLEKRGLDVPVFGVVVFIGDESTVTIAERAPVVPVSHLNTLVRNLQPNYLANPNRIPHSVVSRVRRLLLDEA
ncbi:MAG: NERD domain-containing protein [Chloroflexi bacterium]|nr:NERD domain-containing protein [Chloroflexota bacterium]